MEESNRDWERTAALSQLTTQKELAESKINTLIATGKTHRTSGRRRTQGKEYYVANEDGKHWTFDEALSKYGTDEWTEAK
jgi:hypothetical protein